MADWLTAKVVENKQWTDRLHSLRLDVDYPAFKAGQFTRLALEVEGELVSRPFSLVNSPETKPLDFYFIEVLDGLLSTQLAKLTVGDEIFVAPKAAGLMTLDQLAEGKHLYLLSTGTGIGPFLSILNTADVWQKFEKVVLVHAVRYQNELTYQDNIRAIKTAYASQFMYVPFVSREPVPEALSGRIPQAVADGRFEERTGLKINAQDSQVMLCGNPEMVLETMDVFINTHGLKKHSRREPGQISIEKYW